MLLAQYAPPGIVTDARFRIVELRGNVERFLAGPKEAGADLFAALLADLLPGARQALAEAARTGIPHRLEGSPAAIEAIPLRLPEESRYYLIVFHETADGGEGAAKGEAAGAPRTRRTRISAPLSSKGN